MISLRHITRRCGTPPVLALDDVSLDLAPGEIVALVGENGAGKSSLMNVLYGLYRADEGEVHIRGQRVRLRSPADAIRRGIGMVHQHFMLVPTLTVAENVVLGNEPRRFGLFDRTAAIRGVEETARKFGFRIDPTAPIGELSVGSQQKVEIIKALHRGADVLILDEPTAVLTPQEADELFAVAKRLSESGKTVVFISHKLSEVLSVADRIAVLRRGRKVAEVQAKDTTPEQLAELMVGTEAAAKARALDGAAVTRARAEESEPVLEVTDLHASRDDGTPALRGVSLQVRPGEIVGVAAVDGNGQRELAEVISGLRLPSSGVVRLTGRDLTNATPGERREAGLAHVPEDRHLRAMIGELSVEENLALGRHHQAPNARGPFIDFVGRHQKAQAQLDAWDVRPQNPGVRMAALSGGNQQKVVLARELDGAPKLILVVQPTRGLDIAAVAQVHASLREARSRGAAVLLMSLDLSEVLALSDRLYALYDGRVSGTLDREGFDERRVGQMMLGAVATTDSATPERAHG